MASRLCPLLTTTSRTRPSGRPDSACAACNSDKTWFRVICPYSRVFVRSVVPAQRHLERVCPLPAALERRELPQSTAPEARGTRSTFRAVKNSPAVGYAGGAPRRSAPPSLRPAARLQHPPGWIHGSQECPAQCDTALFSTSSFDLLSLLAPVSDGLFLPIAPDRFRPMPVYPGDTSMKHPLTLALSLALAAPLAAAQTTAPASTCAHVSRRSPVGHPRRRGGHGRAGSARQLSQGQLDGAARRGALRPESAPDRAGSAGHRLLQQRGRLARDPERPERADPGGQGQPGDRRGGSQRPHLFSGRHLQGAHRRSAQHRARRNPQHRPH